MIVIVDYGLGNLGSIQNMLKRVGVDSTISGDLWIITSATKLILPGVGAFDQAMTRINDTGLRDVLDRKALVDKTPILGVCLGMQLLTRSSEEGVIPGLGWIAGSTTRFPAKEKLKIPHMGWNLVHRSTSSRLTEDFEEETRFYFVHSYAVQVDNQTNSILKATHGIEFDAAIQSDNIYGVQFHPEKSHRFGKKLFANFVSI